MADDKYIKPKAGGNPASQQSAAKPEPPRPPVVPILKEATRIPIAEQISSATDAAARRKKQKDSPAVPAKPPAARPAGVAEPVATAEFPYLCPGENFPISKPVCLQRQNKSYHKCPSCRHVAPSRRAGKSDTKEK